MKVFNVLLILIVSCLSLTTNAATYDSCIVRAQYFALPHGNGRYNAQPRAYRVLCRNDSGETQVVAMYSVHGFKRYLSKHNNLHFVSTFEEARKIANAYGTKLKEAGNCISINYDLRNSQAFYDISTKSLHELDVYDPQIFIGRGVSTFRRVND